MKKCQLVTINQAIILKKLGYKESCVHYAWAMGDKPLITEGVSANWNKPGSSAFMSVPTVDEAIDWLRRKFGIVIYNNSAPFVDPHTNDFIHYGYAVKRCYVHSGYNFREKIGKVVSSKNIYAAKRMAIAIALRYISKRNAKIIKMHRK